MDYNIPLKMSVVRYCRLLTSIIAQVLACVAVVSGSIQASFYGDGYARVPVQEAKSETEVTLSFMTSHSNGLLLLAAGSNDYCIVLIHNGAVQVRMDLGSGEATLASPPGLLFNDLRWHLVRISRQQGHVTLSVDEIYTTNALTPGRFFELNIDRNVFAAGTGVFDGEIFFGNFRPFRGCLRDVIFNGVNVLRSAKEQLYSLSAYAVTWDTCSPEFSATSDRPISFTQNVSFFAFPSLETRQEGRITFDIKTRSRNALVVYNSGPLVESDFISIEVVDGLMKLRVNKGSGAVVLVIPEKTVDDGRWHQVEVFVDAVTARLSVDGVRQEERINFGNTRFLDVTSRLYVGGVGITARSLAVQRSLESLAGQRAAGGSLIGCVQNLKVDGKLIGFREAVDSNGVTPECVWTYPCERGPCIQNATCTEEGFREYMCSCGMPEASACYKSGGQDMNSPGAIASQDVLRVHDLVVREGGKAVVTSHNLEMLVDYKEFGIADTSVVFRVIGEPKHGQLTVESPGKRRGGAPEVMSFNMADVMTNKVKYEHDDSEGSTDSLLIEVEFFAEVGGVLPERLAKKFEFTLVVQIAAWNDRPEIHLPPEDTLAMISGTQMKMTSRLLNATDADDPASGLEYTVQYQQGFDVGYFEMSDSLGVRARITRFTQEDVNDGKISYVHRGLLSQQLMLQVSDGKDVGDPKVLKVQAVPLSINLVSNTGLVLPRGSSHLLTRANLTFNTNAPQQEIDPRYEITDPPYDGEIQRQQYTDNAWTVATTFTQKNLNEKRVRYFHNGDSSAPGDYFHFKVSAMGIETQEFEFNIRIVSTDVDVVRNIGLDLNGVREGTITSDKLKSRSTVPNHGPEDIAYVIMSLPRNGQIMRADRPRGTSGRLQKRKLFVGANFTQGDVDNGLVVYKLQKALSSTIDDDFEFRIVVPGAESQVLKFEFRYKPVEGDERIINNGLVDVVEGSSKSITSEDLSMEKRGVDNFLFTITEGPQHGSVQLVDAGKTVRNVTSFTNEDIKRKRVFYKHDDSETEEDNFLFTAVAILDKADFATSAEHDLTEFSGMFDVKIMLKNDNQPRRTAVRPFYVIANSGRIVSTFDLPYIDPDVNFDTSRLEFEWREISNGDIVHAENHTIPVHRFTMREVADRMVYFKHRGPNLGKSVVWVTDGTYFSTNVHVINASDPFLRCVKTTDTLSVNRGARVTLGIPHFGVETNLDVIERDAQVVIIEPPTHGTIKKEDMEAYRFNFSDLRSGVVVYQHDGSVDNVVVDFKYVVKIGSLQAEGYTNVHITNRQLPARIVSNRGASLEEHDSITITASVLNVSDAFTNSHDIVYTVTSQPLYGNLLLSNSRSIDLELHSFTQHDVNSGRLQYEHHTEGHDQDSFQFDVRCDGVLLTGFEFVIDIAPGLIQFDPRPLTVIEGKSAYISLDTLNIGSRYYENQNVEFLVVKEPVHGRVEYEDAPGSRVTQFTLEKVRTWRILYRHDGSETVTDRLMLMAKLSSREKKSIPKSIRVVVQPINNQPPTISINKKLEVWTGSSVVITRDILLAVDNDSSSDEIVFLIVQPMSNIGQFVLQPTGSVIARPVANFTQADINNMAVVFNHRAASETRSGYFEFDVTDGFKTIYRIRLTVEIHELVLAVTVSETLQVFPGLLQPITGNSLRTTTNENNANNSSRPIVYTLQTKPTNGLLVTYNVDDVIQEVTSFTQEDIDSGSIYYKHVSSMVGFTQEDYFVYDVTTAYSKPIKFKRFNVCISLENINSDNRNQVLTLGNVSVVEGGRIEINRSHLDVSKLKRKLSDFGIRNNEVNIVLIRGPEHGILQVDGENNLTTEALIAGGGYRLTQRDINRGQLVYRHDHSDELTDSFTFILEIDALRDRPSPEDALTGCSIGRSPSVITVNIQVRPVNDQPFQLKTDSPGIELIQGFNASIGPTILMTVDADTDPEELRYNITSSPSHGHLVNRDNPRLAINTFTQYDVNQEKIVYIHDGSHHTSDAFHFAVSDGRHKPIFKTFTIRVVLLKLELVSLRNVEILQGEYSAVLTWDNLNTRSNGASDRIRYNITKPALFGDVFVGETESNQFTQKDLDDGNVVYIQTDISSATDSIEIVIYDTYNVIYNKKLKIEVKPRLTLSKKPVQVNHKSGESIRLTLNDTDASDLAILTNSTPVYHVVQEPSRGKLFLMAPVNGDGKSKRETKRRKGGTKSEKKRKNEKEEESIDESYMEKSVFRFTHDDIVKELVAYQPNPTGSRLIQKDNFTFWLTAHNAQSVRARLDIEIIPAIIYSSDDVRSTTLPFGWTSPATRMAPAPAEGSKVEETSGKLGKDKLYIVFLVAGISVLCVLALIVFKCVRRKKKKKVEALANFELNNTKNTTLDSPTTDPVRSDLSQIAPGGGGDVVVPANNETNSILSQNSNSSMTGRLHRQDAFSEEAPFPAAPASGAVPGDGPRAGYVRIVPDKPEEEQSGATTPAGTIKKEHVIFDWESVDPELLEHCRKTNPVLHKNQYWV